VQKDNINNKPNCY